MFIFTVAADNDPWWYKLLESLIRPILEEILPQVSVTQLIALIVWGFSIVIFLSPFGFIPNWKPDKKVALAMGAMMTVIGLGLFFNPLITKVEITTPQNNQKFSQSQIEIPLKVRVLEKEKNKYLWLAIRTNLWYPQTNLYNCDKLNNIFTCTYWIKNEIGTHNLHVLATNKQVNQQFQDYANESKRNKLWKGIVLPKDGVISEAEVTIKVIK